MLFCLHHAVQDSDLRRPPLSESHPTGASMKLSISYKHADSREAAEKEAERSIQKLTRLLKSYEPDLVQLHGVFTKNPHNEEHSFSLNLALPTGTLHATGTATRVRACCKQAFSELEMQVKKHQSRLRRDYQWKRKRPRTRAVESLESPL
jgi:ribosome-associated translation inhibitor RaiA